MIPIGRYDFDRDVTIYAYFIPLKCTYTYENFAINGENYEYICSNSISLTHGVTFKLNPMEIDGYTFDHFNIRYRGNIADVRFLIFGLIQKYRRWKKYILEITL